MSITINREVVSWSIAEQKIVATLDTPNKIETKSALLIISGGNEIRSGSHDSQSQIAQHICALGHYVLRYDRRGIGDSEGENKGFDNSQEDIAAAVQFMRDRLGHDIQISAFGNCDAASALLLYHQNLGLKNLILANPWTIDSQKEDSSTENANTAKDSPIENNTIADNPTAPSAAAIRARYWARIKNPRSLIDLFTGKIDIGKLLSGLRKASQQDNISALSQHMAKELSDIRIETNILIANKDTTAMAFMGSYKNKIFDRTRSNINIKLHHIDSASHSFADQEARKWLYSKIHDAL